MRPCLTHVALHVRDLARSIAFYRDYCGMRIVRDRGGPGTEHERVVWLAEPGREAELIFVLIPGGHEAPPEAAGDLTHLGFALARRADVDTIAERARAEGVLAWAPTEEAYPVGYYCGVADPDGHVVEFSYGQPLGPGAPPDGD